MKRMIFAMALLAAASAGGADFPTFMTGSWRATVGGAQVEELWTTAAGGLMLGVNRTVQANGKASFEFLRIEVRDGRLVFLAMPGGRPATAFPMKSQSANKIVFENPAHDFPQRVLYWRDGNRLCAHVEGTMEGKEMGEQWCWSRAPK